MIYLILTFKAFKRFVNDKMIRDTFHKLIQYVIDWRTSISFFLAWMITNGWSYVFVLLGTILNITWMKVVGESYLAFLWFPGTPEKLVTIPLAVKIKNIFKGEKYGHSNSY